MTDKQDDIKDQIRQLYGERARQASELTLLSSLEAVCCADGTIETQMDKTLGAYSNIYTQSSLVGISLEAIASSAGCGNPTELAGLKVGERVLDLGAGGGLDCFLAARQVGSTGHIIGLDMTADMLALARKNANTLGISNVEFVEGFMENIPLPDNNVDVIISNCVVCLSPDKDAVASEAYRVLTPGGRLHISDIVALGPMPQELREDPQKWARCASGAEEEEAYLEHFRSAGFVDIGINHDCAPHPQEDNMPDILCVKVVAYKP
jgi:arsenite methyltransferase